MLFGDNMYVGNTAVDAAYLGDTQVWSAIPADVKAHIARVTADGGTVPEQAKMIAMVKKLIAANLWNSCVFFGLPLGGVKKDGNQYVSKVYDLKANADLLQATGTAQPKYNSDGSLLYDGGDCLVSPLLASGNAIRNAVNNFSICASFYRNATSNNAQIVVNRNFSATNRAFGLYIASNADVLKANAIKFLCANAAGAMVRMKVTDFSTVVNTKYSAIATYNGTDIGLTVNNVVNTGIYDSNYTTGGAIGNINSPISVGNWGDNTAPYRFAGNINKTMIFNKILTTAEKTIVNSILDDWS